MVFTAEGTTPEIIEEVLFGLRAHHNPERGTWNPPAYLVNGQIDGLIMTIAMILNGGFLELTDEAAVQFVEMFDTKSGHDDIERALRQILKHIISLPEFP
jgi:hypothetical protein